MRLRHRRERPRTDLRDHRRLQLRSRCCRHDRGLPVLVTHPAARPPRARGSVRDPVRVRAARRHRHRTRDAPLRRCAGPDHRHRDDRSHRHADRARAEDVPSRRRVPAGSATRAEDRARLGRAAELRQHPRPRPRGRRGRHPARSAVRKPHGRRDARRRRQSDARSPERRAPEHDRPLQLDPRVSPCRSRRNLAGQSDGLRHADRADVLHPGGLRRRRHRQAQEPSPHLRGRDRARHPQGAGLLHPPDGQLLELDADRAARPVPLPVRAARAGGASQRRPRRRREGPARAQPARVAPEGCGVPRR